MASTLIIKAADFAAVKHTNQRRKDPAKTPYINHPIGVAKLLSDCGVEDEDTLCAALLHDTVEDTETSFEELEEAFGKNIANLVRHVTDDKGLAKDERKRKQVEHAREAPREAKLIKLADKLYNLQDLLTATPLGWDLNRVQGYFVWSKAVLDGCRGSNEKLEEKVDKIFKQSVCVEGKEGPVIPNETDLEKFLEEYYLSMSQKND